MVLLVGLALIPAAQAQQRIVITGARIVEDGSSGGRGGGGGGCQGAIKSRTFPHTDRGTVGGNCYTPFPVEFDPNSGGVFAKEGSNDARCLNNDTLKKVTSQAPETERRKVAKLIMAKFDVGQGWTTVEGKTALMVIYADGGIDYWGIKESAFLPSFEVLDVLRSNPGNGQAKPRSTPCA
ncbi:hypothetical protein [Undibacterium sp. Ji22W]|uniref:hypothetical protein n=1 Tax=Undibacterium sp. Ji22W TaxID=3413038 RepID=UPI003BF0EB84